MPATFKFRKRHAFIILLVILVLRKILRKRSQKRKKNKHKDSAQTSNTTHRHRVVFGGSGGALVYQFGVFKAIIEHFGADKFLKQCSFEGISGGAAVAFFSTACMHGNDTMESVYRNALAPPAYAASKKPFGMLWTTSDLIYEIMYKHVKLWTKQNGGQIPEWIGSDPKVSAWVTCIENSHKSFVKHELITMDLEKLEDDIDSVAKFYAKLAKATTFVPMVLSKWFYCYMNGRKCVDGGVALLFGDKTVFKTKNINNEHCKVLYINCDFSTKRRYNEKKFDNRNIVYYLDIWKWTKFSFADFVIWGDTKHCDDFYQLGYDLAKANMTEIEAMFTKFFSFDGL